MSNPKEYCASGCFACAVGTHDKEVIISRPWFYDLAGQIHIDEEASYSRDEKPFSTKDKNLFISRDGECSSSSEGVKTLDPLTLGTTFKCMFGKFQQLHQYITLLQVIVSTRIDALKKLEVNWDEIKASQEEDRERAQIQNLKDVLKKNRQEALDFGALKKRRAERAQVRGVFQELEVIRERDRQETWAFVEVEEFEALWEFRVGEG